MTLALTSLLLRAANFAAGKHATQRRKDAAATPYINHPLAVAELLATEGAIDDPKILVAALLHDTLEDTDTSFDELAQAFGHPVAALVYSVSDDRSLTRDERKILQIKNAPSLSAAAKLIRLADKICNLRDLIACPPVDWDLKRRQDYFDWAQQVAQGLRGVSLPLEAAFDLVISQRPIETMLRPGNEQLRQAYIEARYQINHYPHNFPLQIGQACQPVWALLWDYSLESAIFITACNPRSQIRTEAENSAANQRLAQRLEELHAVAVLSGLGSDPKGVWPDEPSFLALGLSLEEGHLLANEFEQNAFVYIAVKQAPQLVDRVSA